MKIDTQKFRHKRAQLFANSNTMRNVQLPRAPHGYEMPLLCRGLGDLLLKIIETRTFAFPELRNYKSISVFSDYSGEDGSSQFLVYSFLICAYRPLQFVELMKDIRANYKLIEEPMTIEFKKLRHGKIARLLPDYFRILDNTVPGLLLTVAISKDIPDLIAADTRESCDFVLQELEAHNLGGWKRAIAIKMLRIVHMVAYFCAFLAGKKQNIFWMMDADAIAANDDFSSKTITIFQSLLSAYGLSEYGNIGWALPFEDRSDMTFRDLLSVPDMAAGAVSHVIERSIARPPQKFAPRVKPVVEWICSQGIGLRKLSVGVHRHTESKLLYSRLAPLGPEFFPSAATPVIVQI